MNIRSSSDLYYFGRRENDPMKIDLYRIKKSRKFLRYYPSWKNYYVEEENKYEEERKKGLFVNCKQPGHMSFNCSNKIKLKGFKHIRKSASNSGDEALKSLKKIESAD